MRPERTLPDTSMSLGDESIPFTMQAEIAHMTLDEAIASGLFDVPDMPGMVSIPVTLQVTIPNHLLQPPPTPRGPAADHVNAVPTAARRARTRFGNYPRATAARNIARTIQETFGPSNAADDAAFQEMLKAMRPAGTQAPRSPSSFPSLPAALPIDVIDLTLPRIVADDPSPVGASGKSAQGASIRHDTSAVQAPTHIGGSGGHQPGYAALLRSAVGPVDPDHWAAVGAAAGGVAGAAVGGASGGIGGAVAGGAAGSLVFPGVGTSVGVLAGENIGAVEGALAGGATGAAALGKAGKLAGEFVNYMEGKGRRGGSPGDQGKQATKVTSKRPPQIEQGSESRESQTRSIPREIDSLKKHLDEDHLDAVHREQKGEAVKRNPRNDKPYDHVTEVINAQTGMQNNIMKIKARLGHPLLDPAERATLMKKLGEASRLLDHTRRFTKERR